MGLKVIQYTNQFFGQLGGEEQASAEIQVKEGAVGPGLAVQSALGDKGQVVATVICGDNTAAECIEELPDIFCELVKKYEPDLVIAGPAFNAGRYGYACGAICAGVQEKLGIPAVTGMYKENPGVDLYRSKVYIIETAGVVKDMRKLVGKMLNIGLKLIHKEPIGSPEEEGYFSQGYLINKFSDKSAAVRSVDMLLAQFRGEEIKPELDLAHFDEVKPAPAVKDLKQAKIALVTDGGLVPAGNPDGLEWAAATKYVSIDLSERDTLKGGEFYANHSGYDTREVNENPLRLVPFDVMKELEDMGVIKSLNKTLYSTTGVATPIVNSQKIGQGIVERLKEDGVDAVILTST